MPKPTKNEYTITRQCFVKPKDDEGKPGKITLAKIGDVVDLVPEDGESLVRSTKAVAGSHKISDLVEAGVIAAPPKKAPVKKAAAR